MNKFKNKKIILVSAFIFIFVFLFYSVLSYRKDPKEIQYGISFNTLYARELGLDWKEVFNATINDLGVKNMRLAAHWDMIEPKNDKWNFKEMDYQIKAAEKNNIDVVFAVGRRLPRWPECHIPEWAKDKSWEEQKEEIKEYIKVVVERYKGVDSIKYWQVENEPFLEVFANEHCGNLDVDFLDEEIALVKELDDTRPVLVTDSGNLGTWFKPYKRGDAFGTSVYVYLWNPDIGPFKSLLPPSFYRIKTNLMELFFGKKESMLIELSLEPWLLEPVIDAPKDVLLERMSIKKFKNIIKFAEKTQFEKQYLWGAEWWYYMKQHNYDIFWIEAKKLFQKEL